MGRPSSYSDETADLICERMCEGESLRKICAEPGMPTRAAVCRWLGDEKNERFRDQYARAREAQADKYADELVDIADEGKSEDANIIRLRMDARKWAASKLAPKKYGERVDLNHGGQPDNPMRSVTEIALTAPGHDES